MLPWNIIQLKFEKMRGADAAVNALRSSTNDFYIATLTLVVVLAIPLIDVASLPL
jgi:hypothetical protein